MIRRGPVSIALLGRIVFSGFFAVLLPSGASAACQGDWDLSGGWSFNQDNGFSPSFDFQQTGNVFTGTAGNGFSDDNQFIGGRVNGSVNGDKFRFTVEWTGGTVGEYTGVIDSGGRVRGKTRDKTNPLAPGARWNGGNSAAKCRVAAAEIPNQPKKKPKAPIPGAGDLVLDVPLESGGGTASDAILQAANQPADLTVSMKGPGSLQAGLSGIFTVTIRNKGNVGAKVELNIIYAGKLDQTGRIVAGAGLACEVGHDAGINAALHCTGGQLGAGERATVVVQGRGQEAGGGMLVATLNASRSVEESNYDNNLKQLNITID